MPLPQVEFFKDAAGDHRWRIKAANHKVVADSAEGYRHRADCEHGFIIACQAIFGLAEECLAGVHAHEDFVGHGPDPVEALDDDE